MTENIVTGKKYRILTNATSDIWDRISFWTRASDVAFNDNSTLEASKGTLGHTMLKRSTAYTVGNIAYTDSAPSWVMLRCTTAGTTAASAPSTYGTISSVGTVITDGTAKFTVYDARPNSTLSSSAYQIPTMSLVNNLNSELTANGKQFYFDYKNGKYGYNTSSNRAASTFVPFGGSASSMDKIHVKVIADSHGATWTAPYNCYLITVGLYPLQHYEDAQASWDIDFKINGKQITTSMFTGFDGGYGLYFFPNIKKGDVIYINTKLGQWNIVASAIELS